MFGIKLVLRAGGWWYVLLGNSSGNGVIGIGMGLIILFIRIR